MTSGTVTSLFLAFLSCTQVLAQSQSVQYNQVLNVNGDMKLNSFVFPDRSKVETFSQKQQQIIVNQQNPSIPANQVVGTTGQPFVAVSPQSMTISTNGATDLVGGQIEMAMTMQNLQGVAVQPDNTYVAKLSPDRQTWMIQETMRMVNSTDMTVRMVKRSQMDGEYMVVGRQTVETNTVVVPFGSDGSTSVGIQGSGLQENEFQDGFRMSIRATQPMTMNVDVKDGIDSGMLSALQGQSSVNDYRYSVTTNLGAVVPSLNQQVTVVQMPINAVRIQKMMQSMGVPPTGSVAIAVAQRSVLQNPGGATGSLGGAATTRRGLSRTEFRKEIARQVQGTTPTTNQPNPVAAQLLLAPTFTPVQAEAYILTMQVMGGAAGAAGAAAPAGAATPPTGSTATPAEAPAGSSPAPSTESPSTAAPATESSAATPKASEAEKPTLQAPTNGTESAAPQSAKPEATKPERRQDNKDKYGDVKAPLGSVIMTMKQIDIMAEMDMWGGQVPISKMMNDYVKAQTGKDMDPVKSDGGDAAAKLVVA
ncbi:hypothetical protein PSV09DRAFT_1123626 [Bipolaris maydis]|nr:hypothetical protein PSV09DRAFT_1123626 [Bipolaris maydis]